MSKKVVKTDNAPAAIGPYSQGIVVQANKLVFTAGQIPFDPKTGLLSGHTIEEQTAQSLKNIRAVLEAAGSGLDRVIKTTVFLNDMNNFQKMNEVYAQFFNTLPPARSAVEVSRLPKDVLIEIECVAEVL